MKRVLLLATCCAFLAGWVAPCLSAGELGRVIEVAADEKSKLELLSITRSGVKVRLSNLSENTALILPEYEGFEGQKDKGWEPILRRDGWLCNGGRGWVDPAKFVVQPGAVVEVELIPPLPEIEAGGHESIRFVLIYMVKGGDLKSRFFKVTSLPRKLKELLPPKEWKRPESALPFSRS